MILFSQEYSRHYFENTTNDVRVIGLFAAVILLGVVMIGVQFETKVGSKHTHFPLDFNQHRLFQAQMVLLVVLAVSILSFVLGTLFPPSEDKMAKGITGYTCNMLVT